MINEIIQFYKIGKELGLSRKEINKTLFFNKHYPLITAIILIIILSVFAIFFWGVAFILYSYQPETIYARGTFYSSIDLKDFKIKK